MPFSSWLPAAMAAPTPVSALVHSSTLVTAGVYLIIRFNFIFTGSSWTTVLFYVGSLTMIIAGAAAIKELDIKKIIALRTLSQLGVIIIALGLSSPLLSFFHLLSHAYFKAMLFICAGRIIHTIKDYQDIRTIGAGEGRTVKVIAILTLANLSLCGMPFLSGFYSKDLILEALIMGDVCTVSILMGFIGTILTVAYSLRMRALLVNSSLSGEGVNGARDRDLHMLVGMGVLVPLRIAGGYSLSTQVGSSPIVIILPMSLKLFVPTAIIFGVWTGTVSLGVGKKRGGALSHFYRKM